MATVPAVVIGPIVVPQAAAAALYTSPAGTKTVVTRLALINTSAGAATATLWVVRSGGTNVNSNIVLGAAAGGLSLAAGPTDPYIVQDFANLVLAAGDAIWGLSNTLNAINIVASGFQQS